MTDATTPTTPTPSTPSTLPLLAEGRFTGRENFRQQVRDALLHAAHDGWVHLILSDTTFDDWPLDELAVVQALQNWSRSGRQMTLLAANYDVLVRRHVRFVNWRIQWSHIIDCRRCAHRDVHNVPSAIWSPAWVLRRLDVDNCTGMSGSEPQRRVQLREDLDMCLRQSTPGFAASILGL